MKDASVLAPLRYDPERDHLCHMLPAVSRNADLSRAAGRLKIIEHVSDCILNHHVTCAVLRTPAYAGSQSEVIAFWQRCVRCFGRSKEGGPGSSAKVLDDLSLGIERKGQQPLVSQLAVAASGGCGSSIANATSLSLKTLLHHLRVIPRIISLKTSPEASHAASASVCREKPRVCPHLSGSVNLLVATEGERGLKGTVRVVGRELTGYSASAARDTPLRGTVRHNTSSILKHKRC
jgi:hypothetical protein